MEIDTARSPEPHHLSPITDSGSIPTLDGWIESLMTCKQLAEEDVRRLCDRVGFCCSLLELRYGSWGISIDRSGFICRQEKYCRKSRTFSQWYAIPAFVLFLFMALGVPWLKSKLTRARNAQ